jgi:hypothetical protein
MPVNQQNGVHTRLADLPLSCRSIPCSITRITFPGLHQIPRVLEETTEVMRQGEKDHLMPPKIVLEKLPGQCDGIIAANPFLIPTKKFPAEFSEQDKKRLTDEMTKAVNDDVFPAYKSSRSSSAPITTRKDARAFDRKPALTGNGVMPKPSK